MAAMVEGLSWANARISNVKPGERASGEQPEILARLESLSKRYWTKHPRPPPGRCGCPSGPAARSKTTPASVCSRPPRCPRTGSPHCWRRTTRNATGSYCRHSSRSIQATTSCRRRQKSSPGEICGCAIPARPPKRSRRSWPQQTSGTSRRRVLLIAPSFPGSWGAAVPRRPAGRRTSAVCGGAPARSVRTRGSPQIAHTSAPRSRYRSDIDWLRSVALAEIAIDQVPTGAPDAAARSLNLAETAARHLAERDATPAHAAIARAEVLLGRTKAALRRCKSHLSSTSAGLRIVLAITMDDHTGTPLLRLNRKLLKTIRRVDGGDMPDEIFSAIAELYAAQGTSRRLLRSVLGQVLARRGDKNALMTLIPLYGTTASSSLFACCMLAAMFPEDAETLVFEIVHYRPVDHTS